MSNLDLGRNISGLGSSENRALSNHASSQSGSIFMGRGDPLWVMTSSFRISALSSYLDLRIHKFGRIDSDFWKELAAKQTAILAELALFCRFSRKESLAHPRTIGLGMIDMKPSCPHAIPT
jgi:hypothetical protein